MGRYLYNKTPKETGIKCLHRKAKTRRRGLCPKCYQKYQWIVCPEVRERLKKIRKEQWQKHIVKRRAENKAKYKDQLLWVRRDKYYKTTYGLTIVQFNKMYHAQNEGCFICGEDSQRLHVDHDHHTSRVRGLLCWKCNKGLGVFRDKLDTLKKAVEYLSRDFDGRKI